MNIFSLKDKVVLITGGYGYLGKSISIGLAEAGAQVIVLGRDKDKFNKAFESVQSLSIEFEYCNIAETPSIQSVFNKVFQRSGRIDVLINNAFYIKSEGSPDCLTDESFSISIDGILKSVHTCIREVLPFMRKQDSGKIINVASMYGVIAPEFSVYENTNQVPNPPQYGAAKAGIIQLTKYFASLLGKENILVNSVSPGPFPSETVQLDSEFIAALSARNPLRRIGKPDELKGIFVFLSSESSSFVTGQNISVDGGWTII